jgi:hypothetical protein
MSIPYRRPSWSGMMEAPKKLQTVPTVYKEETGLVVPVDVDTEEGPELDHRVDRAHHCTVEAWQISAALQ